MTKFFRLPDHISDLSPPAAARLENARRTTLDFLCAHDYALYMPALAEYAENLAAEDEDLQLDIFKMTDTMSGRILGIRADHTPQTARFDAVLGGDSPRRLCYCGPALRTRPPQPWKGREIMQLGAEIFNLPPPMAEWEVIRLAAGALKSAGVAEIAADIGHAGIINLLLAQFPPARRAVLYRHIARRDIAVLCEQAGDAARPLAMLLDNPGSTQSRQIVINAGGEKMLNELDEVAEMLRAEDLDININFGEIGGYGYHTGMVFSMYGSDFIAACGGRYDRPGFRPAVGFSTDLREVVARLSPPENPAAIKCIPHPQDPEWCAAVESLRQQNRRLRFVAAASSPPVLKKIGNKWKICEK